MGYYEHHAIIVTYFDPDLMKQLHQKAIDLGLNVSGLVDSHFNGYSTFLVAPDGSKEGWPESKGGDERREQFKKILRGTDMWGWVEVAWNEDREQYRTDGPEVNVNHEEYFDL